jgi:hypothetical protein
MGDDRMQIGMVTEALAEETGAACLDGSLPAFYYREGTTNRFVVMLEGGGWCGSEEDRSFAQCDEHTYNELGSSGSYGQTIGDLGGLLSPNDEDNPTFYADHHVYVKYCDGSSFTSFQEEPVEMRGETLYFRGRNNLKAVIQTLLGYGVFEGYGLSEADEMILVGGSAGGLATILNLDFVGTLLPKSVRLVGVSDGGFFLDGADYSSGEQLWRQEWIEGDNLWGSTAAGNADANCLDDYEGEEWKCLMAPYAAAYVQTPLFIINSAVDLWSLQNIAGVSCMGFGAAPWPPTGCTEDEVAAIGAWKESFGAAIISTIGEGGYGREEAQLRRASEKESKKKNKKGGQKESNHWKGGSAASADWIAWNEEQAGDLQSSTNQQQGGDPQNSGYFVDTCLVHQQAVYFCDEDGMGRNCRGWQQYTIDGTSPQEALTTWYMQEGIVPADAYRFLDTASVEGGNPTCPLPGPHPTLELLLGSAADQEQLAELAAAHQAEEDELNEESAAELAARIAAAEEYNYDYDYANYDYDSASMEQKQPQEQRQPHEQEAPQHHRDALGFLSAACVALAVVLAVALAVVVFSIPRDRLAIAARSGGPAGVAQMAAVVGPMVPAAIQL